MFFILLFPIFASIVAWLLFRILSSVICQTLYKQKTQFGKTLSSIILEQGLIAQIKGQITPATFAKLEPKIDEQITVFLKKKLTSEIPVLGMFADDKLMAQAKGIAQKEIMESLPTLLINYIEDELSDSQVESFLQEKIQLMPDSVWERTIDSITKPLLFRIQMAGAALGFVLGVCYIFFMYAYAWIFV